jgi:hypothetical protein
MRPAAPEKKKQNSPIPRSQSCLERKEVSAIQFKSPVQPPRNNSSTDSKPVADCKEVVVGIMAQSLSWSDKAPVGELTMLTSCGCYTVGSFVDFSANVI